ncbi:MAG: hypothetical protein QY328_08195 [Anaerolineales bacterium]|nr:MAG: hypothetical protein QY328_08195 [Anaerolineales bacterium]
MAKKKTSLNPKLLAAQEFEKWYEKLQEKIPEISLVSFPEKKYLVQGTSNISAPIHRWYSLKESYSSELPLWVLEHIKNKYSLNPQKVLDPFMGGGTTGVSLGKQNLTVYGVEYNPFIRFVSATKSIVPKVNLKEFKDAIKKLSKTDFEREEIDIPEISTLRRRIYISKKNLKIVINFQKELNKLKISENTKMLLRIGVASSIDSAFNLRKDGRALRYSPKRAVSNVRGIIFDKYSEIQSDIETFRKESKLRDKNLFEVLEGTSINLKNLKKNGQKYSLPDNEFDLVLYSPPYLNNFDYSEVYKLELWLMGFVSDYVSWRNLRLGTLRSHPSVRFNETEALKNNELAAPIYNKLVEMGDSICIPKDRQEVLKRTILGYFDDMFLAFKEQFRVMKQGGILCFVVANSRHYYLPIATDIILAEISRCAGFEPLELFSIRKRNGRTRQKDFLRETAVFIKKP